MHSLEWSDSKLGVVLASTIFSTRVQAQWRSTSNTIEMMAWQTKTASAFRIKKNPVALIAPKLSLSVDWWTEWSKTLTLLSSLERFPDMDYLIPTLSKDFQGVIPRPSTSDRGLRWLKEALVRQGVDQALVTPLTWHSFRVFIPDCAYQLGIPRAQRQYLGNWQTESTADIYTREKRNVVVDIWSKVLGKIQEVDLQPGRTVREDLAHPDWDDKPLDKPGDTESVNDSNGFELVQSDAETGLIESEGPNSASTQHTSGSRRTRTTAKSSELLRPLFQEICGRGRTSRGSTGRGGIWQRREILPKASLPGPWWQGSRMWMVSRPDKSLQYDQGWLWHYPADLFHCTRCFHRFRLPSDWGVQDAPAQAVDSDSSVSLSSLTDSSVDTASDSEKVLLPEIKEGEESHLPVQPGWKRGQRTAAAGGADGMLLTFHFP